MCFPQIGIDKRWVTPTWRIGDGLRYGHLRKGLAGESAARVGKIESSASWGAKVVSGD